MAITSDATSNGQGGATTQTSLSWSHTCSASASDLYVGVCSDCASGNAHVTGITYNGVALSSITSSAIFSSNTITGELWHLSAPASGANTIAVTFNTGTRCAANGYSIIGGSATSAYGTPSMATATNSATATVSGIPSTGANDSVIGFVALRGGDTHPVSTVGPNETLLSQCSNTGQSGSNCGLAGIDQQAGNGSTTSVTFNINGSTQWVVIGVAALAAAGGGGGGGGGSTGTGSFYYLRRRR